MKEVGKMIDLKGKIIGFKEYEDYLLEETFGEDSPFRLLSGRESELSFVVVNPYYIVDDYSLEIEDSVMSELMGTENTLDEIAVLCILRPDGNTLYVNLRSPLIINTRTGYFVQTILENEAYGVSVPFTVKGRKEP
jgi:flagellar assembly factor FliW